MRDISVVDVVPVDAIPAPAPIKAGQEGVNCFFRQEMKILFSRFVKFVGIGGCATAFQYILIVGFVEGVKMEPFYASVLSYLMSAVFNYWGNYHFTFAAARPHRSALPRFAVVSSAGLIINAIVFYVLYSTMGFIYLIAQIIASALVLLWNFLANQFWSFSDHQKSAEVAE